MGYQLSRAWNLLIRYPGSHNLRHKVGVRQLPCHTDLEQPITAFLSFSVFLVNTVDEIISGLQLGKFVENTMTIIKTSSVVEELIQLKFGRRSIVHVLRTPTLFFHWNLGLKLCMAYTSNYNFSFVTSGL